MPRYYFNLFNDVDATDLEGQDLPDPAAARAAAQDGIRSSLSDGALRGRIDLRGRIEIAGDGGVVIDTIWFADAVDLLTTPKP